MTLTQATHIWTPHETDTAFDVHNLFLREGRIGAAHRRVLERCSPQILRGARTIAEVAMPGDIAIPPRVPAPARLPIADAVILQSSLQDWYMIHVDDAPGLAFEHLHDLSVLYGDTYEAWLDAGSETPYARLIASCALLPEELPLIRERLAQLRQTGAGDTVLARGLMGALTANARAEEPV